MAKSNYRIGVETEIRVCSWLNRLGYGAERVRRAGLARFGAQDPFGIDIIAKNGDQFLNVQVKTNLSSRGSGMKQVESEGPWPPDVGVWLVLWPTSDGDKDEPTEAWQLVGGTWERFI